MVPSHKIIADRLEFIFSHPLLDIGGSYLVCCPGLSTVTSKKNEIEPTLHKAIGHILEETVRSRKICRLLEVLQEPKDIQG